MTTQSQATQSQDYLHTLIGFESVSLTSNLDLIQWVRGLLATHGIASSLVHDPSGTRANLYASTGPADVPGILLSGHTDVVPVLGQNWTVPAFEMTRRDGLAYGRGAADMKGFIACALSALIAASRMPLKRPLQLALSYDEEIGCVGVRRLIDVLELAPVRPALCVVGEPTLMQLATGHKGKMALRAMCHGLEGHSAMAPNFMNAIHLACDFVGSLRQAQQRLADSGARDPAYDVPYSTVHVGTIAGGRALNIVPNECSLDFEIRHLAAEPPEAVLDDLRDQAERISDAARRHAPQAGIDIQTVNAYPGLDTDPACREVEFLASLLPQPVSRIKVPYGSEGGLFTTRLDVPVVVCGPGSIGQAHKPDEYVALSQLDACDAFLARVAAAQAD